MVGLKTHLLILYSLKLQCWGSTASPSAKNRLFCSSPLSSPHLVLPPHNTPLPLSSTCAPLYLNVTFSVQAWYSCYARAELTFLSKAHPKNQPSTNRKIQSHILFSASLPNQKIISPYIGLPFETIFEKSGIVFAFSPISRNRIFVSLFSIAICALILYRPAYRLSIVLYFIISR